MAESSNMHAQIPNQHSGSIKAVETKARILWDEILTIAANCEISDAVHAILTLNANSQSLISELLSRNKEIVQSLKRISEIDNLLSKPTLSFTEQEHRIKKGAKLEAERKKIIDVIKASREKLLDEDISDRDVRYISKMRNLIDHEGLTLRTASSRVHAEELGKGLTPPAPDTIKKIYTNANTNRGRK